MKDEIKEILDKFDKVLENYELDKKWGQMSVDSICHLFPNEMIIIKDCITNLQEENEKLKDYFNIMVLGQNNMSNRYWNLKSRIDKAIELLKEAGCYDEETKTFCDDIWEELPKLLNILDGDKDE